jgi:hypothetical protein
VAETKKQAQATAKMKADAAKVVAAMPPLTEEQRKVVREMFVGTVHK